MISIKHLGEAKNKEQAKILLKQSEDEAPVDKSGPEDINELWQNVLSNEICLVLVTESDEIVGVITGVPNWKGISGVGRYHDMFIKEGYRRRGLGLQLIERLIKEFEQNGMKLVIGRTWNTNIPSNKLYEKAGFKFLRRIRGAKITGEDTMWYYLELEAGAKEKMFNKIEPHLTFMI